LDVRGASAGSCWSRDEDEERNIGLGRGEGELFKDGYEYDM